MDEETIPLEAGIESRAISLTKGCYVGQEVIIRVLHRGHGRVARKLVGLALDGGRRAAAGAVVTVEDREIGRVTSARGRPRSDGRSRSAYVQRDFVAAGNRPCTVDGGRAASSAALPCRRVSSRISSASAGGNSSGASSSRATHRISCPSCGAGSPAISQRRKCSSTARSG